jgi:hypothetical protein
MLTGFARAGKASAKRGAQRLDPVVAATSARFERTASDYGFVDENGDQGDGFLHASTIAQASAP